MHPGLTTLAAMFHLRGGDIDSFIASTTVPPPPSSGLNLSNIGDNPNINNLEAFIIPPPPQIKTRVKESSLSLSADREVQEMKVQLTKESDKISPKIASLQQQLLLTRKEENQLDNPESFANRVSVVPPPPPPRSSIPHTSLCLKATQYTAFSARMNTGRDEMGKQSQAIPSYEFGSSTRSLPSKQRLDEHALGDPKETMASTLVDEHETDSTTASTTAMLLCDNDTPPTLPPRPFKTNRVSRSSKPELPARAINLASPKSQEAPPPAIPAKASQQRTVVRIKENGVLYPSSAVSAEEKSEKPPALPIKTLSLLEKTPALNSGRKLPSAPSLKETGNGFVLANGHQPSEIYSNSDFDAVDASLEGTSVDNEDDDNGLISAASHNTTFRKAEISISQMISVIQKRPEDGKHDKELSSENLDVLREHLTTEARHFVTASKLFVKSATESETQMCDCLSHCLNMLKNLCVYARKCALQSDESASIIVEKVAQVAETFLLTVQAASAVASASSSPSSNDSSAAMGALMKRATALANVLTVLMRTLRVFS